MAMADYCPCGVCGGKAFYDANITDPHYVATWDPQEAKETDPIGISVLCSDCNKTHETIIIKRKEE